MDFHVVIPARYASTRLPGKPLLEIAGKPMLQHVYERACESDAGRVIIATDDERIQQVATGFGAQVCMTSDSHPSGTDRIAEVARLCEFADDAIIVNVQGDEPCLPARLIHQVARLLETHPLAGISTLCEAIHSPQQLFDPNAVKVVMDAEGYALYFSRAPMPWHREAFSVEQIPEVLPAGYQAWRHIGLYAYRGSFLGQYTEMSPARLEVTESLEQLRAMENGVRIAIAEAEVNAGSGVDTAEDLEKLRSLLE